MASIKVLNKPDYELRLSSEEKEALQNMLACTENHICGNSESEYRCIVLIYKALCSS